MKRLGRTTALAVLGVGAGLAASGARADDLTLCWAAWDPANALVELSKEFEEESGHDVSFEFVPWPNFADRMLNELNSGGQLCDLLIGDSQWIGGGAENGHYVKLNDFFDAEGISMDDFAPATVYAYSTWPKGEPNYYALPAMGDANGWFYRKDWFEREDIRAAFQEEVGRELGEPASQRELMEIAKFFQGREIDGNTIYGASIFTERGSEGITMGVTGALYPWGFKYEKEPGSYEMDGVVNSAEAVEALEFYKELYDCCTPPGYTNSYMSESLDAFKSGQVAMAMNWFAFFPGLYADPDVGGDKIDFFVNPPQNVEGLHARRPGHLGRLLLRQAGRGARVHQVVRPAVGAVAVVGARRVLGAQQRARGSRLRRQPAVRRRLPRGDGQRQGLLAGARLRGAADRDAEADARLRRRRSGHGAGGARQARRGLDRGVRGRRQALIR